MQERYKRWGFNPSQEDPLEESMAAHSNTAAWRIPWTEKSSGLRSWGDKESDVLKQLSTHTHKQHIHSVFLVSEINPIVCYSWQAQNLSTEKESCLFLYVFL